MIEWILIDATGRVLSAHAPTELELWLQYLGLLHGGNLAVLVEIVNGLKGAGLRTEQVWRQRH